MTLSVRFLYAPLLAVLLVGTAPAAQALESVSLTVDGGKSALDTALQSASLLEQARKEERSAGQDVLAAALSDYGRLLEVLYAAGHYGGVISIRLDGREASDIPLLAVPNAFNRASIHVTPGRPFTFGRARVAPLAQGTSLPKGFTTGEPARAALVREAVEAAVGGWRDQGHAKAAVSGQQISANHGSNQLNAEIAVDPGPKVTFGRLSVVTPSAVRAPSIRRIAGLPTGQVFSPAQLDTAAERLRRTGAFSSVALSEGETVNPDGSLDIAAEVADQKPRRYGFGAELSSLEGLGLSAFWMHRNLRGGAERLRFDASVQNIGGSSGMDIALDARLDIPAAIGPDTAVFFFAGYDRLDEPTFQSDSYDVGIGLSRIFSPRLQGEVALSLLHSDTTDSQGQRTFDLVMVPVTLSYDARDNALNPTRGWYAGVDATPFVGLNGSESGLRVLTDLRGYLGLGADQRSVLAARLQFGSVSGSGLLATHPQFLFTSGGGGTVRGQPYQSLGVDLGGGASTGGRSFVGLSTELRTKLTDRFGVVGFVDAGYVGAESFYDGTGNWHTGAGLGVRYDTGIGPLRLDVAAPVGGSTGNGVQLYIGIGQAF